MSLRTRRRLLGLPLAAALVYFFATNSQVVWLYLVSAMLLAMVAVGLAGPVLAVRRIQLEYTGFSREGFDAPLAQDRGKVFAGDTVRLHLRCLGDPFRLQFGPVGLADGSLWEVESKPVLDGQLTLIGCAARRGLLAARRVRVRSRWPIGVITAERSVPLSVELLVHPRYALPAGGEHQGASPGPDEAAQRGAGSDFIGVRDYRPGDSERHIHWPTTARRDALMVVETALESQSPARYEVMLGLDAPPEAVELGISLAASLAAGRAAGSRPFRLRILGEGLTVQRWPEALAALAHASGAGAAARGHDTGFDARVTADCDGVLIDAREGSLRLAPATGIDHALAALAELI